MLGTPSFMWTGMSARCALFLVALNAPLKAHAWAPLKAQLGLKNETYVSRETGSGTLISWGLASGVDLQPEWGYLLQAEGEFPTASQREALFEIAQAAISWRTGGVPFTRARTETASLRLAAGRALQDWSPVDAEWKLGIVEPRYRGDELATYRVGLTGAFTNVTYRGFRVLGFASPLFVPERGVPFSVQDGALVSRSPWFVEAPREVVFLDQSTPLRYRAEVPAARELILHGSAGLRMAKDFGGSFRAGAAWFNKPVPQLALSYDAVLGLDDLVARVDLHPRVARHDVWGADLEWQSSTLKVWAAYLRDRPYENSTPIVGATVQRFAPAQVAAIGAHQSLDGAWASPWIRRVRPLVGISYLHVEKDRDRDEGPLAQGDGDSLFPDRYWMRRAVRVSGTLHFGRNLSFETSFMRDLMFRASLLRTALILRGQRHWELRASADVLGSDSPDGFLAAFRANDRVGLELRYAF